MSTPRTCRVCGCTDQDCSGCIERTGEPCHWLGEDRCSACAAAPGARLPAMLEPEDELALLANRRSTIVRICRGEPLIELGDWPGTGFAPGAEVIVRAVHAPAHILKVRFRRDALRPDVGDVRQDFAALQAREAGARPRFARGVKRCARGDDLPIRAMSPAEPTEATKRDVEIVFNTAGMLPPVEFSPDSIMIPKGYRPSPHDLPLGMPKDC